MNFSFAWLVIPSQYGDIKFCSLKMIIFCSFWAPTLK